MRPPTPAPRAAAPLLLALAGCRDDVCGEVRLQTFPHTVEIAWANEPADAVEYDFGEGPRAIGAETGGGERAATLLGLPTLTAVAYRLLDGDREVCAGEFTTFGVPSDLPVLAVSALDPGQVSPEGLLAGSALGAGAVIFVIDRQGRWRWHRRYDAGAEAVVDVHPDGDTLLFNAFDAEFKEDIAEIRRADLRGDVTEEIRTEGAHHTFAPLPDGGLAWVAVDVREWYDEQRDELLTLVGDRVMERSADGEVRQVFTVWDHETPERGSGSWDSGFYEQGIDWTHGNAVHYSPARGTYLLSLAHLDTIYEIDRESGEPKTRINADEWDIDGEIFRDPHDPNWTTDGTLLVVSHKTQTSAVEYGVNARAEELTEVWSDTAEQGGVSLLGQARRLINGNTLINYGGGGVVREVTPEGETVWELSTPLGTWLGNVAWVDSVFEGE